MWCGLYDLFTRLFPAPASRAGPQHCVRKEKLGGNPTWKSDRKMGARSCSEERVKELGGFGPEKRQTRETLREQSEVLLLISLSLSL